MKLEDIASISEGVRYQGFLPYLQAEVAKMDAALENKVASMYQKGELTPQEALNAWIEKLSYRTILRKFEQKVRVGQAIGEERTVELEKLPVSE